MKMNFAPFMALVLTVALAPVTAAAPPDSKTSAIKIINFEKYAQENAALPPLKKGEPRIVFFGSSVTEGWNAAHPEFFETNNYLCRGISGQSTYALLLRFRSDIIDTGATVVVIGAGEPDIASGDADYSEDRTFANIVSMCELAKMHGVKVILTSVLPAESYYWNQKATSVPDKIESLNKRIEAFARANRLPYADYYTPLVHPGDRALPVTFSDDGVHPNAFGYTIMEPVVQALIKKM